MIKENSQDSRSESSAPAKPARPAGMGGPMRMGASTEKAKDFNGTLKKLMAYIKPYRYQIIMVFILAILSTLFTIISPKILGNATNIIVSDYQRLQEFKAGKLASEPAFQFEAIGQLLVWLLILYTLSAIFSYVLSWVMTNITQALTYQMRKEISIKINHLPIRYFDTHSQGDVLSRVTNDVDTVSQTLNQGLTQAITALVTVVGITIMMLTISWVLTLVALLVLPLSFVMIRFITKKSQKQFVLQQKLLGQVNGHIEEMYAGHQIVKAFSGEKQSIKKFDKINNKLYTSAWKSQFLSGLMWPIMGFVGNLGYVGVAVVGGWLALKGQLKVGDIQAFIQYVNLFNQPIAQTASIANVMQSTVAAAERVFEFLEEPSEPADYATVKMSPEINVKGCVEFKDVIFGYDPKKPVIKGLSASIAPGSQVAIVGPTGAGKTTLVNLLMRFYDIDSGEISIDGISINDMKRSDVRKMFGMVLQDTWLFNGTVKKNITLGNLNIAKKDMIALAKQSQVDHFIRSQPGGYSMEINEEADNVSQGEKQLLTIARAMIAQTPMLILDEATSSVDTRTEGLIQKAMENTMKGKTSFVIAHRLSTIKNADLILFMKDGNVVEQGNHQELLKKGGEYAKLYNSQFALS